MPGVHCISIKLSTSILNLERMMTGRSRTGSLKHLVLFPMFLVGFAKETPKKDGPSLGSPWVQERLCREASSRRTILHQLCMGQGRKQPAYFEGSFLLRGERLFLFFFWGGGAEDNKKRETWDTHNFVMGSLQWKIGNCEFQWFETSRVINQRSAPNVWRKCCLLAFSFKRGIFLLKETVFLRIHDHLKASGIWMSSSILVCMY